MKISIKILIFFHISAQNIDCGYSLEPPRWGGSNENSQSKFWGGSNEYSQCMCFSRNRKNKVYPCKPQFYYVKMGFDRVNIV